MPRGTRFLSIEQKLAHYSIPEPNSGCVLWLGGYGRGGYAKFLHKGRYTVAHRVSYELANGPIPSGMVLDHLCRVRSCINPDHLEPVTNRENTLRGVNFIASHARKTMCMHGHALTPRPDGKGRYCLECRKGWDRIYRARKRR